MILRFAKEKDIERILELLVQVNMVHHDIRPDLFCGPATKYNAQQLHAMLDNPQNPIFVAADDNDLLMGYAFCQTEQILGNPLRTEVKTLYLDDLCVDEACRGQHVGQTLYEHVLSYARDNHYYNVTLHIWNGNESARKFYLSQGMTEQYTCLEHIMIPGSKV